MTLTEILQAHGLGDEAIVKITNDMKANKIFTASEENLDIRYNKLKLESDGNANELAKANALIAELQKGNKGNDELTSKIKDYEGEIAKLKADNEQTRIDAQLDRELIEANVADVDYVKFKIKEKHPDGFKLNEQGKLDGFGDVLDALKVQIPTQFKSTDKKIIENPLPKDNNPAGVTLDQFKKMGYRERAELAEKDGEAYNALVEQSN